MEIRKFISIILLFAFLTACHNSPESSSIKLKWHHHKGYKWATLHFSSGSAVGFKQLKSNTTDIHFINHLSKDEIKKNILFLNGSGVAAGDINDDSLTDLYFCRIEGPNKLYENQGGFHFKDITQSADVALPNYHCTGAVFADVDGDGDLDLLVTTYAHGTILFLNNGKGHFTRDRTSGLDSTTVGGTTMTLADVNNDGFLDLYVAHYREKTIRNMYTPPELSGRNVVDVDGDSVRIKPKFRNHYTIIKGKKGPTVKEFGTKDVFYLNKGKKDGHWQGFGKVMNLKAHFLNNKGKGIGLSKDWGLTARFEDINHDGRPDLYVCNDFWTPDRIWINQGNGIFKSINPLKIRHYSLSAMSVSIGDINNDGYSDLFVSDMLNPVHSRRLHQAINLSPFPDSVGEIINQPQDSRNMLYINRGDNTYAETAIYSGLSASGWSWATTFMDVNLDGREDVLVNNGHLYDVRDVDTEFRLLKKVRQDPFNLEKYRQGLLTFPHLRLVNKAYKNNGNLKFTDVSKKWGFHNKDISQGLALADLNNDGTLDLITNRLNEQAGVYENITSASRIAIRLIGNSPNTQAIGARVVLRGGPFLQDKQVVSGGNYLSGSDTQLMFAAGKKHRLKTLSIFWPDGKKSRLDSVKANRLYVINESNIPTQNGRIKPPVPPKPIFKDISSRLHFKEHEDTYNDFKRQPLLPLKLSQLEPGMAWIDINGDDKPDLLETSGKGGRLAVFENEGNGRFQKRNISKFAEDKTGDQSAVIGWQTSKGVNIIVGRSNYEQNSPGGPSAYCYLLRHGRVVNIEKLPDSPSSTGPLAAADYNEDGTVDLFVGGRVIPSQYPKNASSKLYINKNGHFLLDKTNSKLLKKIGMVTGAVFTDYNNDGWPDLLLSTTWGSLKLFENDRGRFHDVTKQVGLANYHGWWNGVSTGDFNNDGYPDIVATNLGTNSRYKIIPEHSMRMYYNDLNSDGVLDIVQANFNKKMKAYVPINPLYDYSSAPTMGSRVKSYKQFAHSTLRQIIGPVLQVIPYKQINTLQSMVFLNNGGKNFTAHPLPPTAQLTANFDASIADYNNDGNDDIFLSQNFFDLPAGQTRLDSGRGLWLQGNGKGDFTAIPGQKSGIKIYGEQRGAALCDFNGDGKIDLAVSQNGGATKLYVNQTSKAGFRIHLIGSPSNRNAIGSSIRLIYQNGTKGPKREIQAGSGYWSQNNSTQVLGYANSLKPIAILVEWFNGKKERVRLKPNKRRYVIHWQGKN